MDEPTRRPVEPEIIPPGAPLPRERRGRIEVDLFGTRRVYVRPIGPVGTAMLMLAAGIAGALVLIIVAGIAFFGLAAIGVLILVGLIAGLLRGPARPLR